MEPSRDGYTSQTSQGLVTADRIQTKGERIPDFRAAVTHLGDIGTTEDCRHADELQSAGR